MPGDFSDLDAIRVGEDFFAVSSTLQYSPGVAVLHSKDLVNWEIAGHVVDDLSRMDGELNWDKMNRPGRGIWAGSIRYHAGKFWVYFGTPDQGIFMSTAASAAGPWTPLRPVMQAAGWDDPCPFWDDDGQGYLIATHFEPEQPDGKGYHGEGYHIHLFRMNAAGDGLAMDSDRIVHQGNGSEANKLLKIHGVYYHYFSEVLPEGRVGMMERAKSLAGPWEIRQLQHVNPKVDKEPNQGGLVETANGQWYFVTHQGTGDWEGRAGVLLPVTWVDGWPILGRAGSDGIGNMAWRGPKPIQGLPLTSLAASDDFRESRLKPNWEWNYQPRSDKWALHGEQGILRLYAFEPLRAGEFRTVGNVLTQRSMRTRHNEVTVKMDLSGLAEGSEAGLAHYAQTYCTLGVLERGGVRRLALNRNGQRTTGPAVKGRFVWLQSFWGFDGVSSFSYSVDGKKFIRFGQAYQLTWGFYRGDRVGLFTSGHTGYVDIDWFRYDVSR